MERSRHVGRCALGLLLAVAAPLVTAPRASAEQLVRVWDRVYFERTGTEDMFTGGLTSDPDGSLVASGRVYTGNGVGCFVVKTDPNGKELWQRSLYLGDDTTRTGRWGQCDRTTDGGYVAVGYTDNGPLGSADAVVFKLDPNGNKVWERAYGTPGFDDARAVAATPDGGCITAGLSWAGPGAANDVFVTKIEADGSVAPGWPKFYTAVGFPGGIDSYEGAQDVIALPGGGYLVTGVTYSRADASMPYTARAFLLRLDAAGNVLWQRADLPGIGYGVRLTPAGEIVYCGITSLNYASSNWDAFIARADANGNLLWTRTFGGPNYDTFLGMTLLSTGGVAAAGYSVVDAPWGSREELEYLVVTDANGNALAENAYLRDTARFDDASQVVETPDGGIVVAGMIDAVPDPPGGGNGWDAHLVKYRLLPNPASISGTLWNDPTGQCSGSASGTGLPGRLVRLTETSSGAQFETRTVAGGAFTALVPPGTYRVSPLADRFTTPNCPSTSEPVVTVAQAAQLAGQDVYAAAPPCAGTVTLYGTAASASNSCGTPPFDCLGNLQTTPCVGHPWRYCVTVTNTGSGSWLAGQSTLVLVLPGGNRSLCGVDAITCTGAGGFVQTGTVGTFAYLFSNASDVAPGESCTICVTATVDAAGPYLTSASLNTGCGQIAFGSITESAECSCDPNDLTVWPAGCGSAGAITPQRLTYRIRFENVGAGPAHDVVIRNPLDADLDRGSLRIVDTSHPLTHMQIDANGELVLRFDGIELPAPDPADPDANKGYVVYTVEPKAGLADGTVIENGASIYFDTNPQVDTNTTINTIYNDTTVPRADFTVSWNGTSYDFAYTGGESGVSLLWDFGPEANIPTSTDANPSGIDLGGGSVVTLLVDRGGCVNAVSKDVAALGCARLAPSAFLPPMGKRKKLGKVLPVKFKLYFDGVEVAGQEQLDALRAAAGLEPACPEIRVYDVTTGSQLSLPDDPSDDTASDDSDAVDNPGVCFVYANDDGDGGSADSDSDSGDTGEGHWQFDLRLDPAIFLSGRTYRVEVRIGDCVLKPGNATFQTR
ncbi:MAG: hypothetical protein D6776_06695 [Planctomycetota bacterium]|nr:MAG: hypothetical protein D6776_06695 [Planctomycetota bacterium]